MTLTSQPCERVPDLVAAPFSALTIWRLPEVLRLRGRSRSTHYADIKRGLFTPPVHLGVHCVGWPESEVLALSAARISGKSEEQVRKLVVHLMAMRKRLKPQEQV